VYDAFKADPGERLFTSKRELWTCQPAITTLTLAYLEVLTEGSLVGSLFAYEGPRKY